MGTKCVLGVFLCVLASCYILFTSAMNNDKRFINEFFFKLSDENHLKTVEKRAYNFNLSWMEEVNTQLHLFRKTDISTVDAEPVSEEEISHWIAAFGNSVEYIEQDKYTQVYGENYRNELSGIKSPLISEGSQDEHESTTFKECSKAFQACENETEVTERCKPINIAVLDAFFDTNHRNLQCNIVKEIAYDFILNEGLKPVLFPDDFEISDAYSHGTMCMGRIASSAEYGCNKGGDANARLIPLRFITIINSIALKREKDEIAALKYQAEKIHVYSCSYGTIDNRGFPVTPERHIDEVLAEGVSKGRGCKGSIYLFPSGNGNGNKQLDNCNTDVYAKSVNTITIASITMSYEIAEETETCPAALVASFGSPDPRWKLYMNTTKPKDKCTSEFRGTSAATAYAAGMISHALRENSNLSKRDIEHMLVQTADRGFDPSSIKWQTNGAGFKFNDKIGFGAINLSALIIAARTWTHVPEKHTCVTELNEGLIRNFQGEPYTEELKIKSDACDNTSNHVQYLEHVELDVNLTCSNKAEITLTLISPHGTKIDLLTKITISRKRRVNCEKLRWTFMSVHFWGEDPQGEWKLKVLRNDIDSAVTEISVNKLIMHGTKYHPSSGGPQLKCKEERIDEHKPPDESMLTQKTGIIIGVVVGCCCCFFLLVIVIVVRRKHRKCRNRRRNSRSDAFTSAPENQPF